MVLSALRSSFAPISFDEAVLGVKVDVFVYGVGAVAGDERADILMSKVDIMVSSS